MWNHIGDYLKVVFLYQLHPVSIIVNLQRIKEDRVNFHGSKLHENIHMKFIVKTNIIQSRETNDGPLCYLSVVGDTPVDVLHPLTTHGAEAYLQLLWDHITAGTQPSTHLHQRVIITRQRLQDLVRERENKGRDD